MISGDYGTIFKISISQSRRTFGMLSTILIFHTKTSIARKTAHTQSNGACNRYPLFVIRHIFLFIQRLYYIIGTHNNIIKNYSIIVLS